MDPSFHSRMTSSTNFVNRKVIRMQSTFHAPDIECDGCANSIKNALGRLSGVQSVEVDVPTKVVTVTHADQLGTADITAALDKAGFPVA